MSLFNAVRAWLSPKLSGVGPDQQSTALLRVSLEIVSVYGSVLQNGNRDHPIKRPETDLPFSKQQIREAILILQQALELPLQRAHLIQTLSAMEGEHLLSTQFKDALESGLILLDTFVPIEEFEAEREQLDKVAKLAKQIKSELPGMSTHIRSDGQKDKAPR